jgi:type IV fimbrial biogenesis protein FimT
VKFIAVCPQSGRPDSFAQAHRGNVGAMNARTESGFTLLELLTTMAIAGILMAIAVPSYNYVTTANRISAEINGLVGDLQYARMEAVRQGQMVILCPSTAPYAACSATSNWQNGWIICASPSADYACDGTPVLRVQAAFTGHDTMVISNASVTSLSFNRDGFMSANAGAGPTGAAVMLSAHDSTANSAYTRCLATSMVGTLITLNYNQVSVTGQTCT